MSELFYLSEAVKFAVEKEQQAYELYKDLAEKTQDPAIKDLFRVLMQEELHHKEYYAHMLSSVENEQSPTVKEDDEYLAFMKEMIGAGRSVPPITPEQISNAKSAISYAIDREKDSILFYTSLKNYTPSNVHEQLDVIIKEEGKHIAVLLGMQKKVS